MKTLRTLILFLCLSAGLLPPASAAQGGRPAALAFVPTLVWTGAVSKTWNNAGNWIEYPDTSVNRVPQDNDRLGFGITNKNSINDMPTTLHLEGIGINTGGVGISGSAVIVDTLYMDTGLTTAASTISMPLMLASTGMTADIASAASTLVLGGVISGAGKLVKQGLGSLNLMDGASSYSGGLSVEAGTARLYSLLAGGTGTFEMKNNGTLSIDAPTASLENPLQFIEGGTLALNGAPFIFTGPVTLNTTGSGTATLSVAAGVNLVLSGVIQGTGSLVVSGGGSVFLNGASANTYTGAVTVAAGKLYLEKSAGQAAITGSLTIAAGSDADHNRLTTKYNGQFGPGASLTMSKNSEVHLRGTTQTLGFIDGDNGGLLALEDAGDPVGSLTINPQGVGQKFLNYAWVTGHGKIIISGSMGSAQSLNYNNLQPDPLFAGPVEVNGNATFYAASFQSGGPLFVNAGTAAIWYNSAFSSITVNGGTLDIHPWGSPGSVAKTGGLTLTPSSTMKFVLYYAQTYPLQVNGPINLGNGNFSLAFDPISFPAFGVAYKLIDHTGSDPVSGTFLNLPDGARFMGQNLSTNKMDQAFIIHYDGGDGQNDITLTRLARSTLQLSVPPNAVFGSSPLLTASLVPTDPVGPLHTGDPVFFYCNGQLAGQAPISALGSGSAQAHLAIPWQVTSVGPVPCYARFPYTEEFDTATSPIETILFSGMRNYLPLAQR